jgi:hypothetical protein
MTAAELLEQLRLIPGDTPVLVEGYETGMDAIVLLRQAVVTKSRKVQDWDGEYREVQDGGRGGKTAVLLIGRRAHLRGKEVGVCASPASKSNAGVASTSATQLDALLSEEVFASRFGCTPDSLAAACDAHRIFYLTVDQVRMYPAFYVDPRFDRSELETITKCMGDLGGGSKWQFFTTPKGSLGSVTPLVALLAGRFAKVQASALAFFER